MKRELAQAHEDKKQAEAKAARADVQTQRLQATIRQHEDTIWQLREQLKYDARHGARIAMVGELCRLCMVPLLVSIVGEGAPCL